MIKKGKVGNAFVAILLLAAVFVTGNAIYSKNVTKRADNNLRFSFSESYLSEEDLLNSSDLVAQFEVLKVKEKFIKETDLTYNESTGKKSNIKVPIVIYELEVIELVKGEEKAKKIDLVIPDVTIDSNTIEFIPGHIYEMHLYKNEKFGNKAYCLISFSQGIKEIN